MTNTIYFLTQTLISSNMHYIVADTYFFKVNNRTLEQVVKSVHS